MKKLLSIGLALTMMLGLMVTFASGADSVTSGGTYTVDQMLQYAFEDESKAIAEYEAIMEAFGVVAPFKNIVKAEERHLDWVTSLYESMGKTVPTFDATKEVVVPATLEEAYKIGVAAEIENIDMYKAFLNNANTTEEMKTVFTALINGSESHLNAFQRKVDGVYGPNGQGRGQGNAQMNGQKSGFGPDSENCDLSGQALGGRQGQGRGRQGSGLGQNQENCLLNND